MQENFQSGEKMMSDEQSELSTLREKMINKYGHEVLDSSNLRIERGENSIRMWGTIKDKKVELAISGSVVSGKIEDAEITRKDADELWNRYTLLANWQTKEDEILRKMSGSENIGNKVVDDLL